MSEPLVSIIIPVYNAEKYVRKCLDSCRTQTYKNIEVIMVNDGSTDRSAEICRTYASEDSRFVLVSQENAGPASARNKGIKKAAGSYIAFADSDDWLRKNAIAQYVASAENNGASLVVARFVRVINRQDTDAHIPLGSIHSSKKMTRDEYVKEMAKAPADFYYGVIWNKLYRADVIRKHYIFFPPKLSWCEDLVFNLDYLRYMQETDSVASIAMPLYYYLKRPGSICGSPKTYRNAWALKVELFEKYQKLYKSSDEGKHYWLSKIGTLLSQSRFIFSYAHDDGEMEFRKERAQKLIKEKASVRRNAEAAELARMKKQLAGEKKKVQQLAKQLKTETAERKNVQKQLKKAAAESSRLKKAAALLKAQNEKLDSRLRSGTSAGLRAIKILQNSQMKEKTAAEKGAKHVTGTAEKR
jgi:glycosyltransferase involved in cell wall biosynthesis